MDEAKPEAQSQQPATPRWVADAKQLISADKVAWAEQFLGKLASQGLRVPVVYPTPDGDLKLSWNRGEVWDVEATIGLENFRNPRITVDAFHPSFKIRVNFDAWLDHEDHETRAAQFLKQYL